MREIGDKIKADDAKVAELNDKINYIMLRIPNIPNPAVPEGETDEDNVEIKDGENLLNSTLNQKHTGI